MKKQRGFSLIELLITVSIILVIAAIAIPNLLRAKMLANETSAVASIRAINTAEMTYNTTYPDVGFADLSSLAGSACDTGVSSTAACLIDQTFAASGIKAGYAFSVTATADGYLVVALPLAVGQSGSRAFCSSEDGVVRFDAGGATCDATDAAL